MKYSQYFKKWDELNLFEKTILKMCCYLPPNNGSIPIYSRKYKEFSHYQNLYTVAFGNEFWEISRGKTVLDFGCGYGEFVLGMALKGAGMAIGVDIQEHVLNGQQKAAELGLSNTRFIKGSSVIVPDKSVDIITCHDAFEHFSDPSGILVEMIRIVKPGGMIYIKFGPTWMGPYGRHMSGTFRKDRPWIHLIFPEKSIMRIHSVYHNEEELLERYERRPGGLNKMTIRKCLKIIRKNNNVQLESFQVSMIYDLRFMRHIPLLKELFSSSVSFRLKVI